MRSGLSNSWTGPRADLFLIAWIVPAWIVFELSPAKLLHYTMPMLPAVALLGARAVFSLTARRIPIPRLNVAIWALVVAAFLPPALVCLGLSQQVSRNEFFMFAVVTVIIWLALLPAHSFCAAILGFSRSAVS